MAKNIEIRDKELTNFHAEKNIVNRQTLQNMQN